MAVVQSARKLSTVSGNGDLLMERNVKVAITVRLLGQTLGALDNHRSHVELNRRNEIESRSLLRGQSPYRSVRPQYIRTRKPRVALLTACHAKRCTSDCHFLNALSRFHDLYQGFNQARESSLRKQRQCSSISRRCNDLARMNSP